jgi:hypothetical protein
MLTFPDGTQSGVFGLDEIIAAVYQEGRQVNADTAAEVVERLGVKNYVGPSVRQRYCDLLMEEYGRYVKSLENNSRTQEAPSGSLPNAGRRKGLLSKLFRRRSGAPSNGGEQGF